MDVRTLRMALTASLIVSVASCSASNAHSSLYTGQSESIIVSSFSCKLQKISSVINGINGCSSFNAWISTFFKVQIAAALVSSSSLYSLGLTISMYQSQNSSQIKSYTFWRAIPNSYLSRFSVTSLVSAFTLERIHLSASVRSFSVTPEISAAFSIFIIMKREAFHTLFAKLRLFSTRSQ